MDHIETNTALIEAFGDLERLCNQIYNDKHGVTVYIDQMKEIGPYGRSKVPEWNMHLSRLIEIRHKRNMLSHGEVSFDMPCADWDDVDYAIRFRKMILSGTDPLAVYSQASLPHQPKNNTPHTVQREAAASYVRSAPKKPSGCAVMLAAVLVGIAGAAAFAAVMLTYFLR